MPKRRLKRLVVQPQTYRGVQRGVDQLVNAIKPTLGPRPRSVGIESIVREKGPELLDNGAIIARRVIQLPDRDEDVGAMLVREMLWQLHEKVGDGTATAAVLYQAVFNEGLRYIAAGGNAQRLRHWLDEGLRVILAELDTLAQPVSGKAALARVAQGICHDPELAAMLGEIFDIIGEHGQLDVRSGRRRGLEREYVEGSYWPGGALSREMLHDGELPDYTVTLENAALLMTDLEIEDPLELVPALRMVVQADIKALVIVARRLSDKAISFLLTNSRPEKLRVLAVKTPGSQAIDQSNALLDMAALTGGEPILRGAGQTLEGITLEHLGRARAIWVNRINFGLRGGRGDARQLRQHIRQLRASYERIMDAETRRRQQQRIGKLIGGSATLRMGGATDSEIKMRKELAEHTAEAVRGAVREGVLPGGGVALLACSRKMRECSRGVADDDQRAAYRILARALEEPARVLLTNAGYEASEALARITLAGGLHGLDIETGQVVDMVTAGVLDVAAAQRAAVHSAVSSAALALTIDVLVHRKKQRESASLVPGKSNDFYDKKR